MASTLKVVSEVEVPNPEVEQAQVAPVLEAKSTQLSAVFRAKVAMLAEIRKILNARAAALIAMLGAMGLTGAAMFQQTTMSLLVAISFDVLVLIPIVYAAYFRKGE